MEPIKDNGGIAPCGKYPDDTRREQWRQEFSCCIVGCKSLEEVSNPWIVR